LIGVVVAAAPVRTVLSGATGRALIPVLGATGRTQLVMGTLLAIGIAVSA
jgi:1,4-dihydroxy-2-naphthoate octaprenyltransferase